MDHGLYVGLMSGTSMDRVDAVLVEIDARSVHVRHQSATAIPDALGERLARALDSERLPALECWRLDAEVGELFARAVARVLIESGTDAADVTAIGSHGQTLYHAPDASPPLTIQIGDPNVIASRTGIPVVADFRRMDVAAGGQGAPLAPLFHAAVFTGSQPRGLLNLGGIANVSLLPGPETDRVVGFDTGPANTLLDGWCNRHRSQPFDDDGRWAASGTVQAPLLERLLREPYLHRPAPKSTGRELFNLDWLDAALSAHPGLSPADVQCTLAEFTATTVADALARYGGDTRELYVCGGGALNGFLMQRLAARLPRWRIETTQSLGIPPQSMEGAAFAWLAHQRLTGRAAGRPSVTGAVREACLGGVYRP